MRKSLPTTILGLLLLSTMLSGCTSAPDTNKKIGDGEPNKPAPSAQQEQATKPGTSPTPGKKDQVLLEPDISDPEILKWRDTYKQQRGVFYQEFKNYRTLLISLGEQPTGGYAVNLKPIEKVGNTWQIQYAATRPAPDSVLTQAITYPHQLLALPKDGSTMEVSEIVGPDTVPQNITTTPVGPVSLSKSFIIETPLAQAQVGPTITVQGLASVFEGAFLILLRADDKKITQIPIQTAGAPDWGSFTTNISLPGDLKGKGQLIFAYGSAATGELIEELTIPVTFK